MTIKVLRPGLLTTLQDLGRYGFQRYGVIVSGAMDSFAHRLANILVGNSEAEATMEITMLGPVLEIIEDTLCAICGTNLRPSVDGKIIPLWRPVLVRKGSQLRFLGSAEGCRAYLAVAGGFQLEKTLGSKSTYLRAGIGGYQGRALQQDDVLMTGEGHETAKVLIKKLSSRHLNAPFVSTRWHVTTTMIPAYQSDPVIRIMRGKEFDLFTEESQKLFLQEEFKITTNADRMGYRLEGPKLNLTTAKELISEAVAFGTVQVPPGGDPIVLMADRQTTGGYPKLAQIASVDLPLIAQAKPGDCLRFQEITHNEAQKLYVLQEEDIKQFKLRMQLRIKKGV